MVIVFFHKESVPNWPTILYFSGPTLSSKPYYSASYFLRHSNRESSITLGGEITISLPRLYYTGLCNNCLTLVTISVNLFKSVLLYKWPKLRQIWPNNTRYILHVVNSNYLKLCRGGGCNGLDRMGDLGEESDIFRCLKERENNPFYSEKQTPNLRDVDWYRIKKQRGGLN